MKEQPQVNEIKAHGPAFLAMEIPKSNFEASILPRKPRCATVEAMVDRALIFVGVVYLLAGFVKGVVGLGLPTISMGLLATAMPPVDPAGILLLPSFVTNVWQMLAGRALGIVFRRLWPMMFAVCAGTWTGLGLMTGASARFGTALLGVALAIYAITGLGTIRRSAPRAWEHPFTSRWRYQGINYSGNGRLRGTRRPPPPSHRPREGGAGPGAGAILHRLAVNVGVEGGLQVSMGGASIVALASGCMGMWIGQSI